MPDETETETATNDSPEIPVEVEDQKTIPVGAAAPPAAAAPAAVSPPPLSAEDKLAILDKEKRSLHDQLLRTAADFDNFRKRSRKELDDARAKAREDVIREVLPVVDNLERALASSQETSGPVFDGVKLVLRQLTSALERFEVKGFASVGEVFDPARHEAISQVETPDRPAGTVHLEMQKGYVMGSRLVRPAMVAVAKAPSAPSPPPPAPAPPEAPAAETSPEKPESGE